MIPDHRSQGVRTYAGIPLQDLLAGIQALQADLLDLDRESRERTVRVHAREYRAMRDCVTELRKRQSGRYGLLGSEERELARYEERISWFETHAPEAVRLANRNERKEGIGA